MDLKKLKTILKSKTFYGGLAFAIVKYLEAAQVITPALSNILQPLMMGIGLFGARNSKPKNIQEEQMQQVHFDILSDPEKTEIKVGPAIKGKK